MLRHGVAAVAVVGALSAATAATAQYNTTCSTIGQQTYCHTQGAPRADPNYGKIDILTPAEAQRQAAEAQLATIRAQRAQAELDAYRRAQQERAAEDTRANEFAAKIVRCSEANPDDAGYNACMARP